MVHHCSCKRLVELVKGNEAEVWFSLSQAGHGVKLLLIMLAGAAEMLQG